MKSTSRIILFSFCGVLLNALAQLALQRQIHLSNAVIWESILVLCLAVGFLTERILVDHPFTGVLLPGAITGLMTNYFPMTICTFVRARRLPHASAFGGWSANVTLICISVLLCLAGVLLGRLVRKVQRLV